MQLKDTSRRHHPLIPVISVQSSNCFAQSAMWRSLHNVQISPSRYPCSRCSTTATIISGGTTWRGNSNYTLTVWKRWLKQTEGRPLYYLTLHLFSSPISSNHLLPFLSPAQSLLKKLSLFSSVSNYLHLLSGHLRIKTWWDHSQGATTDLTISFTLFCCCLRPVNYTKCLSSESRGQLQSYFILIFMKQGNCLFPNWFLLSCQSLQSRLSAWRCLSVPAEEIDWIKPFLSET